MIRNIAAVLRVSWAACYAGGMARINRRRLLQWTGAAGAAAVAGRFVLMPPSPSRSLASVDELAKRLHASFDDETRSVTCVEYDHPLRQLHNRGVATGGMRVWWNLDWGQCQLVVDLLHAGLSEVGRERVPKQYFLNWPGVHVLNVLFCGDPANPPYQVMLSGPHLNLRLGGTCREGVAFGGPQIYGDQRGDLKQGLPGNVYRYQWELASELFESLSPGDQERAACGEEPVQTLIEYRGRFGELPGAPLAEAGDGAKRRAAQLVDAILENYPREGADYARACLDANGGVGGLSVSHYRRGEAGRVWPYQIFRLEGPAAVFHYRGHPHLHAFMNVGMDATSPLSVGEALGENPTPLDGASVAAFFEEVLKSSEDTDVAYYPLESVAGRLRTGLIRSGDLYNLESWGNEIATVEVDGKGMRPSLVEALKLQGIDPNPGRTYTVATTGYVANSLATRDLGRVLANRRGVLLRDAAVAYVENHGFS